MNADHGASTPRATPHVSHWTVPADHPALPGHFPGHPIMPGVTLLAEVLERAARHLDAAWLQGALQISAAKFLSPLQPGDACRVELTRLDTAVATDGTGSDRVRFEIRRGATLAATGTLARARP